VFWLYLCLLLPMPLHRLMRRDKWDDCPTGAAVTLGIILGITTFLVLANYFDNYQDTHYRRTPFPMILVFLVPVATGFIPYGLWHVPEIIRWLDYFFVKHPAEDSIASALERAEPIDARAVSEALTPRDPGGFLVPAFHYKHQTESARALAEKLRADAELAEAIVRRERARAEAKEVEADAAQAWRNVLSIRPRKLK
jgi:hypothetical protein